MTPLEQLQERAKDHARRALDARRRYREDLPCARSWPGQHPLERAWLVITLNARFRAEGRALADEAAELQALGRSIGIDEVLVDERGVQAVIEELTGGGVMPALAGGKLAPWIPVTNVEAHRNRAAPAGPSGFVLDNRPAAMRD